MKKDAPVKIININRNGQVFNPSEYLVRKDENPEFYKLLEAIHVKRR